MRNALSRDARGISLMEIIATIGVMAMVLLMVNEIFVSGYETFVRQSARVDNEVGALLSARAINDATRGATTVLASQTINGTLYTSDTDTLVLQVPAIDASDAILDGLYDLIAIYRDGTDPTLVKTDIEPATGSVRLSGQKTITANNESLTFRYNAADPADATRIQTYIVNSQIRRSLTLTTKAWTAIFLRNK